jgi:hypothetical protein
MEWNILVQPFSIKFRNLLIIYILYDIIIYHVILYIYYLYIITRKFVLELFLTNSPRNYMNKGCIRIHFFLSENVKGRHDL